MGKFLVGDVAYEYQEVPCHIGGKGYEVTRVDGDRHYYVRILEDGSMTCECWGYLDRDYCRHTKGLGEALSVAELKRLEASS